MPIANLMPRAIAAQLGGGQLLDDQVLADPAARALVERMADAIDPLFVPRSPASTDAIVRSLLDAFDGDGSDTVAAIKERARQRLMTPDATEPAAARAAFTNVRAWAQLQVDGWAARLLAVDPATEMATSRRIERLFEAGDNDGLVRLLESTFIGADQGQLLASARILLELMRAPLNFDDLGHRALTRETMQAIAIFVENVKTATERGAEAIVREIDAAQGYIGALAMVLEQPPPGPLSA